MPATTSVQKAAFDAIDSLHFSQVVMSLICADPDAEEWYRRILGRINSILQREGITGKQAQIAKHYLLGALEIYLSIDSNYFSDAAEHNNKDVDGGAPYNRELHEQFVEHSLNYSIALLCNIADFNGVDREFFFRQRKSYLMIRCYLPCRVLSDIVLPNVAMRWNFLMLLSFFIGSW